MRPASKLGGMANQIQLTVTATVTQGSFKDTIAPGQLTVPLTAQGYAAGLQEIGFAAAENVTYDDVAAADVGWCFLQNMDATNYVDYGVNDTGSLKAIGRLLPGEYALIRIKPSAQLMAQANVAAVKVLKKIYRA